MTKIQMLEDRMNAQDGLISVADAAELHISKEYFMEFVRKTGLERVAHGVYLSADAWQDAFQILQMRFPNAVYSHEAAAYLLNLAEREPLKMTVTVKSGYHAKGLSETAKVYQIQERLLELGVTEVDSPFGHPLRCYNAERTVCDLIRSRSQVEIQDLLYAVKTYIQQKGRNIPLLTRYAKELRVSAQLHKYLEVLL